MLYLMAPREDEQLEFVNDILVINVEVRLQRCTIKPSIELSREEKRVESESWVKSNAALWARGNTSQLDTF